MKPHPVLVYGAAVVAVATLVLAGREVAYRFIEKKSILDLASPILAVATALICIAVLDWARNVRRRTHRHAAEDAEFERLAPEASPTSFASQADSDAVAAIQALESIANEEFGPEKAIEEAVRVVAGFTHASFVGLWLTDEQGMPTSRAEFGDGEVILFEGSPVRPADEEVLRQVVEYRKPVESRDGDDASYFFPLLSGQTCFGILKITVAGLVAVDEGDAAQRLSAQLGRVARHLGRAVRAPALYDQAVVDALTGLYTRRHFVNRLTEATGVSRRYGEPLSLILIDVDNFKMLNTTYGTPTGDRVLRDMATLVQQNVREIDGAFRYGSDEIAIILPDTEVEQARALADRLRRIVRDNRALSDEGGAIITTVSTGVTEFDEDMRGIGPLLARAEEALYAAKDAGRDRVETWSEAISADTDEQDG